MSIGIVDYRRQNRRRRHRHRRASWPHVVNGILVAAANKAAINNSTCARLASERLMQCGNSIPNMCVCMCACVIIVNSYFKSQRPAEKGGKWDGMGGEGRRLERLRGRTVCGPGGGSMQSLPRECIPRDPLVPPLEIVLRIAERKLCCQTQCTATSLSKIDRNCSSSRNKAMRSFLVYVWFCLFS